MKEEFKKGDYIVLIDSPIDTYGKKMKNIYPDSFKINYIYKQKKDYEYLMSEIDSRGSRTNGWSCYAVKHDNWRYATAKEIEMYEEIGRPFDVTSIKIDNFSII